MKKILVIFLVLGSVGYLVLLSVGQSRIKGLVQKKQINPQLISQKFKETASTVEGNKSHQSFFEERDLNVDADRDYLLWRKINDEVEAEWNKEIYTHIQYLDRENADELYRSYLELRKDYLSPQQKNLAVTLDDISKLNGESIPSDTDHLNPEEVQDEFITNLRRLFREHYASLETQRKIFLDNHPAAQ